MVKKWRLGILFRVKKNQGRYETERLKIDPEGDHQGMILPSENKETQGEKNQDTTQKTKT